MRFLHLSLVILATFVPLRVEAAPKGAVPVDSTELFQVGAIMCAELGPKSVSGRLLPSGLFYPRTAEAKNTARAARAASGRRKFILQTRVRTLRDLARSDDQVCAEGSMPTPPPGGTPTATPTPTPTGIPPISLRRITDRLYHTEHVLFIIPEPGQVTFEGASSWDSVYSATNMDSYVATLKATFPADYFFVVLSANELQPPRVPNVLTYRSIAAGIGEDSITGVEVPNICRYHTTGNVIDGFYAVLDHEIGHNWGVFIGTELGSGHWLPNSTVQGQMADSFSNDGFATVKQITGNPATGFRWQSVSNLTKNETETFSEQDLYLQGLAASFPTAYVLEAPIYNSDGTVSYSSVAAYDQSWIEARNGLRSPTFRTAPKRFKLGFVYIARDLSEITNVKDPVERSARHFSDGETIDTETFRFQVPYLVASKYRGSVDSRLADLDGNSAPSIIIDGSGYVASTNGNASVGFAAADPDGTSPAVSCVRPSVPCEISGNRINLSGLPSGATFVTVKAEDAGGKRAFAHLVVEAP